MGMIDYKFPMFFVGFKPFIGQTTQLIYQEPT